MHVAAKGLKMCVCLNLSYFYGVSKYAHNHKTQGSYNKFHNQYKKMYVYEHISFNSCEHLKILCVRSKFSKIFGDVHIRLLKIIQIKNYCIIFDKSPTPLL